MIKIKEEKDKLQFVDLPFGEILSPKGGFMYFRQTACA